jgi:hypothetical protein
MFVKTRSYIFGATVPEAAGARVDKRFGPSPNPLPQERERLRVLFRVPAGQMLSMPVWTNALSPRERVG